MKNDVSNNFVTVQGWMVTELKLKGNDLLLFALIFGFCQDGQSEFKGSWSYMMKWLNCGRKTVFNSLVSLTEKGFLTKREEVVNNVKYVFYKTKNMDNEIYNYNKSEVCNRQWMGFES